MNISNINRERDRALRSKVAGVFAFIFSIGLIFFLGALAFYFNPFMLLVLVAAVFLSAKAIDNADEKLDYYNELHRRYWARESKSESNNGTFITKC